jgi:uncharacterized protein YecE (DUF72 family)
MPEAILIGTSGWTYPDWKGVFYPAGLPQRGWLEHYAEAFDAVEVNASFYRIPKESTARSWHDRTPPGFRFVLKMSRLVTHVRRLAGADREIEWFFSSIAPLAPKLAGILIQLPPSFAPGPGELEAFFRGLPETWRYFVEFRNAEPPGEETIAFMRERGLGFCINDYRGETAPLLLTSDTAYIRFHGWKERFAGSYPEEVLREWAGRIWDWNAAGRNVLVFFNNDAGAAAVANAMRLKELLGAGRTDGPRG